ncbi:MAG: FKBP-type peptidyl-prolyl cis-trans isomerase [Magnetococcales bacterium]|nr:FKBP-type peptidyl-prolyl cis-trans isomerase [Magnetococcales bacterium]
MNIRLTHFRILALVLALFISALTGCSDQVQQTNEGDTMALEENAKKEGVTVTDSGLQYEVLIEGDGAKPKATDTVKVHYAGTLTDGKEFDSSYKRGQPISFPLNRVIAGWTEGLQLMSVGSKYRLTIPGDLAYGSSGVPQAGIGPNATLIFDVELLGIE